MRAIQKVTSNELLMKLLNVIIAGTDKLVVMPKLEQS
jgi:hypothetical protein